MFAAEKLFDAADRLGALEAVKRKLVSQPDRAAVELETALLELSKIYGWMETELTSYLSLRFDGSDAEQLKRERDALDQLTSEAIRERASRARGRCGKIWNIYARFLTPWFARVLKPDEAQAVAGLFRELSDVDSHMVDAIDGIASWLTDEAAAVAALVEADRLDDANYRVVAGRSVVQPVRTKVSAAMRRLHELEAVFIEVSGAV